MQTQIKEIAGPAFQPLKVVVVPFADLPDGYKIAIFQATDTVDLTDGLERVRIETYSMVDVKRLLEVFRWPASISALEYDDDRERVRLIMSEIKTKGQWPYVSYWAKSMAELSTTELEIYPSGEEELYARNHGDGWHRMIASIELNLPSLDFVFLL